MSSGKPKYFFPKQGLLYLISVSVSVAVFFYLKATISWEELITTIQQISPWGLVLFVLFSLTMSVFRTWRYILLLRIGGHATSIPLLFLITLVRNLFSDLLPARLGTLIYIYLARSRLGISWSGASASFAYSFIFDILSLGFLILLATLATLGLSGYPWLLMLTGLILAIVSGGLLVLLPRLLSISVNLFSTLSFVSKNKQVKLTAGLQGLRTELMLLQKSGMLLRILILSFGVRCCKYISLYCLLLALVIPLGYSLSSFPLPKVFFGLTAAEMAASLPISGIAGFGAYEGAWSLVFQLLGYSEKLSALTSVTHHLTTQVYGYALGGVAFLLLLLPWRRKNEQAVETKKHTGTESFMFYLRSLLLLLVPLICAYLVLFANPAVQQATSAGTATLPPPKTNTTQSFQPLQPLPGKVVFQRPDGIYTITIGSRDATRLTSSGSSPRWSPDGKLITFVDGNRIKIMTSTGQNVRELTRTSKGKAVCFHPDGDRVLYTDRKAIKAIEISNGRTTTLATGNEFFELDISHDGTVLVATEKKISGGYRVVAIDLTLGEQHTISSGCSASISPNGKRITANASNHKKLLFFHRATNKQVASVEMIEGKKFDNQYWSNHQDWFASKSDGTSENIYLHHIPSSAGFQITFSDKNDRPDYFIKL